MFNNYAPYNPMAPMQNRLQQYEQQYPQFNQINQQNIPQTQNYIKCQPVTSIEEAKAAMIDLDGSVHVFTDLGNGKIYTKQINLDGTATLNIFEMQDRNKPLKSLEERVSAIEIFVSKMKGVEENGKSNADYANDKHVRKQSKSNGDDATNVRE